MWRIIVVCTGNICRSPMAEGILRKKFQDAGSGQVLVSSMGIEGLRDHPASEQAVKVCAENRIDIGAHRSRPVVPEELVGADLILTMDLYQRDFLRTIFSRVQDRIFLFGAWPGKDSRRAMIPDPYNGTDKDFQRVFRILDERAAVIVPRFLADIARSMPDASRHLPG